MGYPGRRLSDPSHLAPHQPPRGRHSTGLGAPRFRPQLRSIRAVDAPDGAAVENAFSNASASSGSPLLDDLENRALVPPPSNGNPNPIATRIQMVSPLQSFLLRTIPSFPRRREPTALRPAPPLTRSHPSRSPPPKCSPPRSTACPHRRTDRTPSAQRVHLKRSIGTPE